MSRRLMLLPFALMVSSACGGHTPAPAPRAPVALSAALSPSHCSTIAPPSPVAAKPPSRETTTPSGAAKRSPEFEQTPTLHLWIGDHWLEVLESSVAGDITLDGKVILHRDLNGDDPPWADLVRYFGPIAPFAGVVLLSWRAPGNACGRMWGLTFVGVRGDGTWERADVPYCSGADPTIVWAPTSVTIVIPPQPPNRGDGVIPGETWVYRNGAVTKLPRTPASPP